MASSKVREKIQAAIAPWRTTGNKPPFTVEQLVAMALLSQLNPMTTNSIFHWINETFSWYAKRVSQAFCAQHRTSWSSGDDAYNAVKQLRDELDPILMSYEFPSYVEPAEDHVFRWNIDVPAGLELLRLVLDPSKTLKSKKASFFALPAELRNKVYDMIFQYPTKPGLVFPPSSYSRREDFRFEMVVQNASVRNTRPITTILAPLRTCRQFYGEAMPSFYRVNHFHFADLDDLQRRLSRLPSYRRRHLSHVTIAYPRRDRVIAAMAFENLTKIEHLRILNLRIEETTWVKWVQAKAEREGESKDSFQSALDMPGMNILRTIRGLEEVNVSGIRKDTLQSGTVAILQANLTREKETGAASKRAFEPDPILAKKVTTLPSKKRRKPKHSEVMTISSDDDPVKIKKAKLA